MLNGLMNIGQSALNASSAWISVTGNNIANADTEGYSRQYVDQKDAGGLKYSPGAQPLGVNAQQIMRFFDAFLERSYVTQSATSSRWDQQDTIMASLENIFNESNRVGINSALTNFFKAWQELSLRPDSTAVRQSLVSYADNLSDMFGNTMGAIKEIQEEMNVSIRAGVDRVNDLAKSIADLNRQITTQTIDGINNPNSLLDKRDQLVRELATYVDVETIDHGKGKFRVQLSTGQPLVDGVETYELAMLEARKENRLLPDSPYSGEINFDGNDNFEYTVEITQGGKPGEKAPDAGNPRFKVSIDGGVTWLKGEDGKDLEFELTRSGLENENGDKITDPVLVKNLKLSFTLPKGENEEFKAGDKFDITPKKGLYWIEPTRGPQNITPQITLQGDDNPNRVTGGKLAAYFNVRDDNCGRYMDELDAVARSLIWEVNRIHSQGVGLNKLDYAQGQEVVGNRTKPLGTDQALTAFSGKLQEGNVTFHFYDKTDGSYKGSALLPFTDKDRNEKANFDPDFHSLDDVKKAIDELTIGDPPQKVLSAEIQDGKLIITSTDSNIQFAMGADSSGLMAALGINSFFAGYDSESMAVNSQIHSNTHLVAAGQINGDYEGNVGDNATAIGIGALLDKPVTVTTFWKTIDNQSLNQYYANLVTTVGADRRTTKTNNEYHSALTNDLYDRVASVTGVNMDEEMSNLIKFQHSYTAAAKLITTADQMLQTLLGLKQ